MRPSLQPLLREAMVFAAVALTVANEPSRDPTVELVEAVHGKLQEINGCMFGSLNLSLVRPLRATVSDPLAAVALDRRCT